jgi:hypothetical protein
LLLGGDWQGGADPARRTLEAPLATQSGDWTFNASLRIAY